MKSDLLDGDSQYYQMLATRARQQYNESYAAGYRESDGRWINAPTHTELNEFVTEVSMSFGRPIAVLDLGCGTGRYFHCLRNLRSLTGVDISPDMLRLARHPVREGDVLCPLTLVCGNIADVRFADKSFDLIYSMGVFGHFLPLDAYILEKVERMLKGGGMFVFTVVDKNSPRTTSWKRRAAETVLPMLPRSLKRNVQARLRSFCVSEDELRSLITRAQLFTNTIKRRGFASLVEIVCVVSKD